MKKVEKSEREGKTVIEIWAKDKFAHHKDNIQISDICKLKLK